MRVIGLIKRVCKNGAALDETATSSLPSLAIFK